MKPTISFLVFFNPYGANKLETPSKLSSFTCLASIKPITVYGIIEKELKKHPKIQLRNIMLNQWQLDKNNQDPLSKFYCKGINACVLICQVSEVKTADMISLDTNFNIISFHVIFKHPHSIQIEQVNELMEISYPATLTPTEIYEDIEEKIDKTAGIELDRIYIDDTPLNKRHTSIPEVKRLIRAYNTPFLYCYTKFIDRESTVSENKTSTSALTHSIPINVAPLAASEHQQLLQLLDRFYYNLPQDTDIHNVQAVLKCAEFARTPNKGMQI